MIEKFIKISDLKKKLNYIFREYGVSPQMRKTINEAINKIPYTIKGDLETTLKVADVQEVVRCKDCKHLLQDLSEREAHLCMRNRFERVGVNLDDFCSYGEREETDNG